MRELSCYRRVEKLIGNAIKNFDLNLKGITVLTEAASGPYVVTPLIAAMAGADKVIAVTRDSRYGTADDVKKYMDKWISEMGLPLNVIEVSEKPAKCFAKEADLVTNLGFLRPITEEFINELPPEAAISLMWEPWEFRNEDLDLQACIRRNIPVLGTYENHRQLQTFRYVGMCAVKLLLELEIEIFFSNIVVIGSGYFGEQVESALKANGANVIRLDPTIGWRDSKEHNKEWITTSDAVVICEHKVKTEVLGGDQGVPVKWLVDNKIALCHICGNIYLIETEKLYLNVNPSRIAPSGFMSVATDYVGPRPVIDLHTAGLKVGQQLVEGMRKYKNAHNAAMYAIKTSPGLDFN